MDNAELYSSANAMQKSDAEEVIKEFHDKLQWRESARILDIGCGTGEVTAGILMPRIPKDFSQLVGADISSEMVRFAKGAHVHPKLYFVELDVAHQWNNVLDDLNIKLKNLNDSNFSIKEVGRKLMSMKEGINNLIMKKQILYSLRREKISSGFDVVTSFYCLHWVQNQRLALTNIYNLLKPGGEALLVLLAKSPIFTLYNKVSKIPDWSEYMQDVDNFITPYHHSEDPQQDFVKISRNVGFTTLFCELRDKSYTFPNAAVLKNTVKAVSPFSSRIPPELQEKYFLDCLKAAEELKLAEINNNSHKISYKLLVAHLRRPKQ